MTRLPKGNFSNRGLLNDPADEGPRLENSKTRAIFLLIHPQLGLGLLKTLFYGPSKPNEGLEPLASGVNGYGARNIHD
ncbi:MAG: hypothetical protein GWP10_03515 [Nitrospiraceae bacterium]|nr:hypothetical protein [Nitrospiraceae bacterium]